MYIIIINNTQIHLTSAMPRTELKNQIKDRQQITEALGTNVYGGTSGNEIPKKFNLQKMNKMLRPS